MQLHFDIGAMLGQQFLQAIVESIFDPQRILVPISGIASLITRFNGCRCTDRRFLAISTSDKLIALLPPWKLALDRRMLRIKFAECSNDVIHLPIQKFRRFQTGRDCHDENHEF